jgi:hypothetical protein
MPFAFSPPRPVQEHRVLETKRIAACGITRPCSPAMLALVQVAVLAYCARARELQGFRLPGPTSRYEAPR